MTIDEAIKHCLEVADKNEISAITYKNCKKIKTNMYEKLTAEKAENDCRECAADHRQLAEWLTELKELREENKVLTNECDRLIKEKGELLNKVSGGDVLIICQLEEKLEKAKSMILDYSYTVEVMCNRIKNTMGCENCTYCNEETYECTVGAFISRTRAFAKGDGESESNQL